MFVRYISENILGETKTNQIERTFNFLFQMNYVAVDFGVVEKSADGRRLAVRQHKQVVLRGIKKKTGFFLTM